MTERFSGVIGVLGIIGIAITLTISVAMDVSESRDVVITILCLSLLLVVVSTWTNKLAIFTSLIGYAMTVMGISALEYAPLFAGLSAIIGIGLILIAVIKH